jgi:hypothetical protein
VDHLVGYYASVHAHLPELPAPWTATGLAADGTHARRDGRPQQDPAAVGVQRSSRILNRWSSVRAAFPDAFAAAVPERVGEGGSRIAAVTEPIRVPPPYRHKRQNVPCVYATAHANQQVYLNLSKDRRLPVVCHDKCVAIMEEHGSTILCDNDWDRTCSTTVPVHVGDCTPSLTTSIGTRTATLPKMRHLPMGPSCVFAGMGIAAPSPSGRSQRVL